MPLVSAIMTVRNGETYLAEAIDSLLDQSLSDIEVVVNDNGSMDGTQAILADYEDPRLKVLQVDPTRQGSFADGIARAFEHAAGAYVAVLDSDDVALADRFAAQAGYLNDNANVGLVGSAVQWIDGMGAELSVDRPPTEIGELAQRYAWTNPLAHSSVMFRRALAVQLGGYDIRYKYACDYAMALAIQASGHKVAALPQVLVRMRRHVGQVTQQDEHSLMRSHDRLELLKKAQVLPDLDAKTKISGQREVIKAAYLYARELDRAGRRDEARLVAKDGRRRDPLYYYLYATYRTLRVRR